MKKVSFEPRRLMFLLLAASALCLAGDLAIAAPLAPPASPAAPASDQDTLRVCASAVEPPYSERNGTGFENKIAWAVAQAMGRQLQFVWLNRPAVFLVDDLLNKKECDVVIGLDSGDPRVLTTRPYYRTGYVFITRASQHLDIHSWSDPRIRKFKNIAVEFGSPSEQMMRAINKYADDFTYEKSLVNFKSNRNQVGGYLQVKPTRLIDEIASGKADLAVAFAPGVARYVKSSTVPLHMTLVDDDSIGLGGKKVPEQFDQSMGVRKNDLALAAALNAAIVKARPEIDSILKDEGIPLLKPHS